MKSIVAVGISMLCLLYSFPNLHAEENLIFSDTYLSQRTVEYFLSGTKKTETKKKRSDAFLT